MNTQLSFFNTISLSGEALRKAQAECSLKDVEVLQFFITNHTKSWTPWEVTESVGGLFTSVRRSITTLTAKGFLVKTDEQRMERFSKPNYCWKAVIN